MQTKILHSPLEFVGQDKNGNEVVSKVGDIIDYLIEEAEVDQDGKVIIDLNTGRPKWTGRTLKWSIRAGETLEFPAYVADYLTGIFSFLQEVKGEKKEAEKAEGAKAGDFRCRYCGKSFATKKQQAMHMGAAHWKEITEVK